MNRRNFLKLSSTIGVASLIPTEVHALYQKFGTICPNLNGRKLILIQLAGGNDGLNTLIPIYQYDTYASLRPTLRIQESGNYSYITLDSTLSNEKQVGLHPRLSAFKNLYEQGLMQIIQGVGYPNFNKSHFKSTDLWLTGGDGTNENFLLETGWMGRFADNYFENYKSQNYPVALQLGSSSDSLIFHNEEKTNIGTSIGLKDESNYYSVIKGVSGIPPNPIPSSEYGDKLSYILQVDEATNRYKSQIEQAFAAGSNSIAYPDTDLANQLKTAAKLISGNLNTSLYLVKLSGFDTHVGQAEPNASHTGYHAYLLATLSQAVEAFILDLKNQNLLNDTLAVTFSEFGRKAKENADYGTDHGEVAPIFLFGNTLNPGIKGTNINLSEAIEENNYQINTIQYDYRSVFTTLLQDWMGATDTMLNRTFYDYHQQKDFLDQKIDLIHPNHKVLPECYKSTSGTNELEWKLYPNPFHSTLTIFSNSEISKIYIYSIDGKVVYFNELNSKNYSFDLGHLSNGSYIFVSEFKNGVTKSKKILKQ